MQKLWDNVPQTLGWIVGVYYIKIINSRLEL